MLKFFLALNLMFSLNAFAQKAEALKLWEKRDEQKSLEEALAKFEQHHKANPQELETLVYLARGNFLLADFHQTKNDQKMETYEKARKFGILGMSTNPEFKKTMDADDIETAVSKLSEKEVPAMFWTAAATGKWARLNGVFSSLKYKDEILALIKRVEALNPKFFHSSVPRYWGGYYAVAPSIAGGDMKKSKQNFEEAIKASPEYLGTKVLFAELYWVKQGDRKEFKRYLEEVIAAPNDSVELGPENRMEKKKAETLLGQVGKLF